MFSQYLDDDIFVDAITLWDKASQNNISIFMYSEERRFLWTDFPADQWKIKFNDPINVHWESTGRFPDAEVGSGAQELFVIDTDNNKYKVDARATIMFKNNKEAEQFKIDLTERLIGINGSQAIWTTNQKQLFHLARSKLWFIANQLKNLAVVMGYFGYNDIFSTQLMMKIDTIRGGNEKYLNYCFEQAQNAVKWSNTSGEKTKEQQIPEVKKLFMTLKGF